MSKGIPETRRDMLNARYSFLNHTKCKSCAAPIEWWLTTHKKKVAFDPPSDPADVYGCLAVAHRATCANSEINLRKRAEGPQGDLTERQTPELLERETGWFARRHNARAVLVLGPDASLVAWVARVGEDPEQLRMDLITLANRTKRELEAEQNGAAL